MVGANIIIRSAICNVICTCVTSLVLRVIRLAVENLFISSLENEFSTTIEDSAVYKINNNINFELSQRFVSVFNLTKEYYAFSNKTFNPSVYPLNKLWGFDNKEKIEQNDFVPPTDDEINKILNSGVLDYSKITIEQGKISKQISDIQIDFGGVLKGYASKLILDLLNDNGYTEGYCSFGSSSISLLKVKSLAVRHPLDQNQIIMNINCQNQTNTCVSTSGDYEKFFDYNGSRYSHIIDTSTGKPSSTNVKSATIISKDGTFADAMTTSLCLLEYNQDEPQNCPLVLMMKKILEYDKDASIFIVYSKNENKTIITNNKQDKDFFLLYKTFSIKNI